MSGSASMLHLIVRLVFATDFSVRMLQMGIANIEKANNFFSAMPISC